MVFKKKKTSDNSELRQDPITETWAIIAAGRAKRPSTIASALPRKKLPASYEDSCVFCNTRKFRQRPDVLRDPPGKNWRIRVFENKFPALTPAASSKKELQQKPYGPFSVLPGVGFHEIAIVRDHDGFLYRLPTEDRDRYVSAWLIRYRELSQHSYIKYIQIFENSGPKAGGSVEHPHSQIFALPVLPEDASEVLFGAERYVKKYRRCGFCDILKFEGEQRERVVYENDKFVVIVPFVPRVPHEQWIIPKTHSPKFELLSTDDAILFSDALGKALSALAKGFHTPDYNFQIYSAPCDAKGFICPRPIFGNFHWHARILPRMGIWGGLELATGLEIVTALPEESAQFLQKSV